MEILENPWTAILKGIKKAWWNGKYEMEKLIWFMIPFSRYKSSLEALPEMVRKNYDFKITLSGKSTVASADIIWNIDRMTSSTW